MTGGWRMDDALQFHSGAATTREKETATDKYITSCFC